MKRPPFLPVFIGTGFGSGFSPFAPGTAGALLASIIWIALYFLLPFSWVLWLTAALVIVFTFAGIWAADKLETYWGEDPSRVVVDEMVGVWIPLLAVPNDDKWFWYVIAAFLHRSILYGLPFADRLVLPRYSGRLRTRQKEYGIMRTVLLYRSIVT